MDVTVFVVGGSVVVLATVVVAVVPGSVVVAVFVCVCVTVVVPGVQATSAPAAITAPLPTRNSRRVTSFFLLSALLLSAIGSSPPSLFFSF